MNPIEHAAFNRAGIAARADYEAAYEAFHRAEIDSDEYTHRQARAMGLTANPDTVDDDADCPEYTLMTWANAAIDGKHYKRKTGPRVRFALAMPDGMVLEIAPQYCTNEDYIADIKRSVPEMAWDAHLPSDCNWQCSHDGYALAIYRDPRDRVPAHRGWFDGYGHPVITTGPQEITDAATEALWRAHRDPSRAFSGLPFCGVCRKPLTDDISRRIGIGPDCARTLGISHSARTARILDSNREAA